VEIVVAMSVLVVAATIFGQMLLRRLNLENAMAADAARVVLERMHNTAFLEVYRAFNQDPADDPLGKGTGPGHLFDVEGLTPLDNAPQGKAGTIVFPSLQVQTTVSGGGAGGKKVFGDGGTTVLQWQLREDYQDPELGMPRDLNGNNVVDTANHSTDYVLLPVRVEVRWKNGANTRRFELVTQLGDIRKKADS
jgi:hypothetical protein